MKYLILLMSLFSVAAPDASAQALCASDGQFTPVTIVERFINADCEACWQTSHPPEPSERTLSLDWIVPSAQGDQAALSTAASTDALMRLKSLGLAPPATSLSTRTLVTNALAGPLRVAHGVALGGYIGASIELTSNNLDGPRVELSAWLILVETIAAGTDGTPSERNLVRNVLVSHWAASESASTTAPASYREMRPLSIAPDATPARLRVVGWVQDAHARVLIAAQSFCLPPA